MSSFHQFRPGQAGASHAAHAETRRLAGSGLAVSTLALLESASAAGRSRDVAALVQGWQFIGESSLSGYSNYCVFSRPQGRSPRKCATR